MKTLKYIVISLIGLAIASCGGKNSEQENGEMEEGVVRPASTEITGDLAGCFTVVDRNYKPIGEYGKTIIIELNRTEKDLPFDESTGEITTFSTYGSTAKNKVGFGIEFLDKEGNIVEKKDFKYPYSNSEPVALVKTKPGQTNSLTFMFPDQNSDQIVKFRITSATEFDEGYTPVKSNKLNTGDIEDIYNDAVKTYNDAYDKAVKQYNDAYDKAVKDYENAVDKAVNSYGL